MTSFTPISALVGGIILGLASLGLLLFLGRIAGISGITFAAFTNQDNKGYWRWLFLLGLVFGGFLVAPEGFPLVHHLELSWPMVLIAGFLVGFGSRLGSGCTSGHAICGIGRLSVRSMVATVIFMVVAAIVVYIMRHVVGGSIS